MAAGNLLWLDIEAFWNLESEDGNIIDGIYNSGETYLGVVIFNGGAWVSKYTNIRYRQGLVNKFIARNEAAILKEARKLVKKVKPTFEIGQLRRVGQQATQIYSNKSPSGIKYYPMGSQPVIIVSFEGSFRAIPWTDEQKRGLRPRADVL